MTLKEHLFSLPNDELADYLIVTHDEEDDDGFVNMWYITTDRKQFWYNEYEEAIAHQVKLLESEYEEQYEN